MIPYGTSSTGLGVDPTVNRGTISCRVVMMWARSLLSGCSEAFKIFKAFLETLAFLGFQLSPGLPNRLSIGEFWHPMIGTVGFVVVG